MDPDRLFLLGDNLIGGRIAEPLGGRSAEVESEYGHIEAGAVHFGLEAPGDGEPACFVYIVKKGCNVLGHLAPVAIVIEQ